MVQNQYKSAKKELKSLCNFVRKWKNFFVHSNHFNAKLNSHRIHFFSILSICSIFRPFLPFILTKIECCGNYSFIEKVEKRKKNQHNGPFQWLSMGFYFSFLLRPFAFFSDFKFCHLEYTILFLIDVCMIVCIAEKNTIKPLECAMRKIHSAVVFGF